MGRLAVTAPPLTTTVTSVAEDGSAFGFKLSSVSSTLTGATIAQPAGAPPATTVDLGAVNPNNGEKVKFNFKLPDGTTESIELTALTTTTTPPAAGTFQIGVDTAATTVNLQAALTASIKKLADTSLVAASAIQASDNFFNASATISGGAVNNKAAVPAPITGATLLSGAAATDSLGVNFAAGDTITVNGTPITFVASGATGNQLNITDSVQTLMQKINSITGTTAPSTVNGGVITLHGGNATDLTVTSSNTAAFAALGFGATVTANPAPLRVGGPPFATATTLVAGTAANTVIWYTGEAGSEFSARHRGCARRPVDHRSVWRARRRAGFPASAEERRGVRRGHDRCFQSKRQRPEHRAQPAHRIQSRAADRLPVAAGYPGRIRRRAACGEIDDGPADPAQEHGAGHARTRSRAYRPKRSPPRSWRCRPALQASYQTTATLYQTSLLKYL